MDRLAPFWPPFLTLVPTLVSILAAYLLSGVPTAYLLGHLRYGVDLRRRGSGNLGASNAAESLGRTAGMVVLVADAAKGVAAMALAALLGVPPWGHVAVALAAVAGHNFSPYLRFSGGRGVATALGVSLVVVPWVALAGIALGAVWFGVKRKVVAAGFVTFAATNLLVVSTGAPVPTLAMCAAVSALVLVTHVVRERAARTVSRRAVSA